jgi:CBS domain-containing protein
MAITLTMGTTISAAVEETKRKNERSIYIVDNAGILVGAISQGDIIRLDQFKGFVESIMQLNPVYVQEEDLHTALKLMKENRFFEIPVVDKNYKFLRSLSIWELI